MTMKLRDDKSGCTFCNGKGRIPTDLWNQDTAAMWEPCPVCHEQDAEFFYAAPEAARLQWFVGPR